MSEKEQRAIWQNELINLITEPEVLFERLTLAKERLSRAKEVTKIFPLRVTESYLSRIQPGNFNDPLLRQILPLDAELDCVAGYSKDPLLEVQANPVKGLLHKYKNRVLITLTSNCAIHCRYCFRRHFPYNENNPGKIGWTSIYNYLFMHPEINEVILSGGDPLSVNNEMLQAFSDGLVNISNIRRLRLHTRIPVVLPGRIDDGFISWLKSLKMQCIIVLHVNHAKEIDASVSEKLNLLANAGVTLLNQSVLLKGVNNEAEILAELSEKLFENKVLPYYLHLLDKVAGAQHFDLPLDRAKAIYKEMQSLLPGYLLPRMVFEEGGAASKTLIW